jgi:hypothetical protein
VISRRSAKAGRGARPRDGHASPLPLGPTIDIVAILGSVLFLFHVSMLELAFGGALLVVGLAFGSATRFFGRAPAGPS